MTYSAKYIQSSWYQNSTLGEAFGSSNYLVMSWWMEQPSGFAYFIDNKFPAGPSTGQYGFELHGFGSSVNVTLGSGIRYGSSSFSEPYLLADLTFNTSTVYTQTRNNFLISVDTSSQTFQVYINDVPVALTDNNWNASDAISWVQSNTISQGQIGHSSVCTADIFWHTPGSFFDLSIEANRRLFINSDLTPVDLGTDGSIPFGTQPKLFMSNLPGGTTTDWLNNLGSIGGTFLEDSVGTFCEGGPLTLSGVHATGAVGTLTVSVVSPPQFNSNALIATEQLTTEDRSMFLRYSDTAGATWSNKVKQSIGLTGELDTNVQFQRLGLARNRVFEISWSGNFKSAVTGVFVSSELLSS